MPRKAKIPPEFNNFKEVVEKTGLVVRLERLIDKKIWVATVIKDKHCIWHNDGNPKEIPLEKFWESVAWKTYEKSLAKS